MGPTFRSVACAFAAALVACSGGGETETAPAERCGPFPQQSGAATVSPGVRFEDATSEQARSWTVPPGLSFEVLPPVSRGRTVEIAGVLRNTSAAEVDAIYLTGGAMFRSTNPFGLEVDAPQRPLEVPETPEVYPMPRRAVLPAGSEVRFVVAVCADAYEHTPGATSQVRWRLELWNEPRPSGTMTITWPSP